MRTGRQAFAWDGFAAFCLTFLHTLVNRIREHLSRLVNIRPRIFKAGEVVNGLFLVPNDEVLGFREHEVIAAPNYRILADSE